MNYPSLNRRFFAFILDLFEFSILTLLFAMLLVGLISYLSGFLQQLGIDYEVVSELALSVFIWLGIFGYFLFPLICISICERLYGRTPAKKTFSMRVVRVDGKKLTFIRSFMRTLIKFVFPLGMMTVYYNDKNQALHDVLTKTVVIFK